MERQVTRPSRTRSERTLAERLPHTLLGGQTGPGPRGARVPARKGADGRKAGDRMMPSSERAPDADGKSEESRRRPGEKCRGREKRCAGQGWGRRRIFLDETEIRPNTAAAH